MQFKDLKQLQKLLIQDKKPVSRLEFTKNNYDNGKLIEEALPTITTDYCEIGLLNNSIYFTFIIESKTFSNILFNALKDLPNVLIYGFVNFNKTLYPKDDFNYNAFIDTIKKDKYLQIQLNFKSIDVLELYNEYENLVDILKKSKSLVVNQLKIDLTK